ncbi:MAG: GH3 auxin-responsive promoter family protein [Bacteroidota bacterium]
MAILGPVLNRVLELQKTIPTVRKKKNPFKTQHSTLVKLLKKSHNTSFGRAYKFNDIVNSTNVLKTFQRSVPVYDYNKIYKEWWHKTIAGEVDVCWPGKVKYFALSSGTSESSSKYIPVTTSMLKAIKRAGVKQILTLVNYEIPEDLLNKGFLMIGGSTKLNKKESYAEGDLSGITTGNIPFWFQQFYKPGKEISAEKDWTTKIEKIVESAPTWDIGVICGVPAWIQIVLEKIIKRYNLKTIHDMWPNMKIYVSGGVSFEPYRTAYEKLFEKPVYYIDTYLASEGFMAFQTRPQTKSMQLILNNGIFFEFVPFTDENFDAEGNIIENPEVLLINQVEEGKDYALLISTCSGAWRYLIGDTVRFTDKDRAEIVITGRTKHYLSLCGEHLSVENMTTAINKVAAELNFEVPEFAVSGIKHDGMFAHRWYLGTNAKNLDAQQVKTMLDAALKEVNDDYAVERISALKDVFVEIIPLEHFYGWMRSRGKEGGQNKFPRVLKNSQITEWESFLTQNNITISK